MPIELVHLLAHSLLAHTLPFKNRQGCVTRFGLAHCAHLIILYR